MNRLSNVLVSALAALLLLVYPMSPAYAHDPDPPESEAKTEEERRELAEALRRLAELSQQLDVDSRQLGIDVQRIVVGLRALDGEERPRLGVVLAIRPAGGVEVQAVTPGGPADEAGLRSGDVVESIDGHRLLDTDAMGRVREATEHLSGLEDGQSVTLVVLRDGEQRQVDVLARPMPAFLLGSGMDAVVDADVRERLQSLGNLRELGLFTGDLDMHIGRILPFAGCGEDVDGVCRVPQLMEALRWRALNLATVEPDLGRYFGVQRGVLVVSSDARLQGLEPGDVIISIDGTEVGSPAEAMRELSRHPAGTSIPVRIQRDGEARDVTLTAPAADAIGRLLQLRLEGRSNDRG